MSRHDDAAIALEQQRRLHRRGGGDDHDIPMPKKPAGKDERTGDRPTEEEKE